MTTHHTVRVERRVLQVLVLLGACVPVAAGLYGVIGGERIFHGNLQNPLLDSHLRYLSGILLAVGLSFWSFIPAIEKKTVAVRALTILVFIGGLCRLGGMIATGESSLPIVLALMMELLVTPALCLWQSRIAARSAKAED